MQKRNVYSVVQGDILGIKSLEELILVYLNPCTSHETLTLHSSVTHPYSPSLTLAHPGSSWLTLLVKRECVKRHGMGERGERVKVIHFPRQDRKRAQSPTMPDGISLCPLTCSS
jgi:hypothetical protein